MSEYKGACEACGRELPELRCRIVPQAERSRGVWTPTGSAAYLCEGCMADFMDVIERVRGNGRDARDGAA